MLLDKYLAEYDFHECHSIRIEASAQQVYDTILNIKLREFGKFSYFIFGKRASADGTFSDFMNNVFIPLEREQGVEVVSGMLIRLLREQILTISPSEYIAFNRKGYFKAAWNFSLQEDENGMTKLTTETRIKCYGRFTRVKFAIYWFFINKFSGIIRKKILKTIKKHNETNRINPTASRGE